MSHSQAAETLPYEGQVDPAEGRSQLQEPSLKVNSHAIVIFFCTSNLNKLLEVQSILGKENVLLIEADVDLCEIQGPSVEAIAAAKCRQALQKLQLRRQLLQKHPNQPLAGRKALLLTEDTCLCFNALKGLPGPYIKWFLESVGVEGLPKMLVGFDDKSAYALCTLSVCEITIGEGGDTLHDANYVRRYTDVAASTEQRLYKLCGLIKDLFDKFGFHLRKDAAAADTLYCILA